MSVIQLSGYKNNTEHSLVANFNPNYVLLEYDNNQLDSINTKEFLKKARSYLNDNYGKGQPYLERDFLKQFKITDIKSMECTLLRCLAITIPIFNSKIEHDDSIEKDFNRWFYDELKFDWTGDLGVQPYIYMINHNLIQGYKNAINKLYKNAILYKYSVNAKEAFFVPFDFSDYPQLADIDEINVWNSIKRDINKAIRKKTRR